jgi:hypothetical protein
LGLGTGDFALWLATTTVVVASINKCGVVTNHVVDICLRVGGFLELSVSKDNDLTYDFKCGCHFLKTILTSKSIKKLLKVIFYILLDLKSLPILAKM